MVELQSCAALVNTSALCAIEQEVKGDRNALAEILAELQTERQNNAELMERISILEAQLKEREKHSPVTTDGNDSCSNEAERSCKKFKRQSTDPSNEIFEDGNVSNHIGTPLQANNDTQCVFLGEENVKSCLINWMSMDDIQFLYPEELNDNDSATNCDGTDDTGDEDNYFQNNVHHKDGRIDQNFRADIELQANDEVAYNRAEHSTAGLSAQACQNLIQDRIESQRKDCLPHCTRGKNNFKKRKETNSTRECKTRSESRGHALSSKAYGSTSSYKKPQKIAFCPKEVKKIIESEELLQKNAQSHTIRKIIVFTSLGIRHGCEDMYELDFSHFSILRKGEQYMSPSDPGEHVLYENPGVLRKIFYPNRQNPTLCPVQILEEERAMRPSDASCPSRLFLCIKYGGSTRNLPQNEYVRQRMGRNKLKSFGPTMCRIALLAHIRTGSFFFKALGITLLFMAGFSDDLVRRETKYRNLDLLQKYYRTDEDAQGVELFLQDSMICDDSPHTDKLTGKTNAPNLNTKRRTKLTNKNQSSPNSLVLQSAIQTHFGLFGYTPIHAQGMTAYTMPSHTSAKAPKNVFSVHTIPYRDQSMYPFFPPQPSNSFAPIMYWPPPNAYFPCPYLFSYSCRSVLPSGNQFCSFPQPYYSNYSVPNMTEGSGKNEQIEDAGSDSDST